MKAILTREVFEETQTLGTLVLKSDLGKEVFTCKTLELAWKNNKKTESCIPKGNYNVATRKSPKYGNHFHISNVKNRSFILIHSGNYYTQIEGCILIGDKLSDINNDGYKDVTNSKATLKKLLEQAKNGFKLEIVNV